MKQAFLLKHLLFSFCLSLWLCLPCSTSCVYDPFCESGPLHYLRPQFQPSWPDPLVVCDALAWGWLQGLCQLLGRPFKSFVLPCCHSGSDLVGEVSRLALSFPIVDFSSCRYVNFRHSNYQTCTYHFFEILACSQQRSQGFACIYPVGFHVERHSSRNAQADSHSRIVKVRAKNCEGWTFSWVNTTSSRMGWYIADGCIYKVKVIPTSRPLSWLCWINGSVLVKAVVLAVAPVLVAVVI